MNQKSASIENQKIRKKTKPFWLVALYLVMVALPNNEA